MAMEALENARRDGKTLSYYAKARGLTIWSLYHALVSLQRNGYYRSRVVSRATGSWRYASCPGCGRSMPVHEARDGRDDLPARASRRLRDRVRTKGCRRACRPCAGIVGCCDLTAASIGCACIGRR